MPAAGLLQSQQAPKAKAKGRPKNKAAAKAQPLGSGSVAAGPGSRKSFGRDGNDDAMSGKSARTSAYGGRLSPRSKLLEKARSWLENLKISNILGSVCLGSGWDDKKPPQQGTVLWQAQQTYQSLKSTNPGDPETLLLGTHLALARKAQDRSPLCTCLDTASSCQARTQVKVDSCLLGRCGRTQDSHPAAHQSGKRG